MQCLLLQEVVGVSFCAKSMCLLLFLSTKKGGNANLLLQHGLRWIIIIQGYPLDNLKSVHSPLFAVNSDYDYLIIGESSLLFVFWEYSHSLNWAKCM